MQAGNILGAENDNLEFEQLILKKLALAIRDIGSSSLINNLDAFPFTSNIVSLLHKPGRCGIQGFWDRMSATSQKKAGVNMLINCTKKLLDELKIKSETAQMADPLFSWHANIIKINRKKTLVLVNDASRHIVVMHGIKAKDFKDIGRLITQSIKETLLADCIKPEIVDRFIADGGEIVFSKTQNRTLVARMNEGCKTADIYDTEYNENTISQPYVSKKASGYIFIDTGAEIKSHPNEVFYSELEKHYGVPIFSTKALDIKITLCLENFEVWRRVVVPMNMNFRELHKVIRVAFDWGWQHLHDFMIFENGKPAFNIIDAESAEDYDFDIPMLIENKTIIADYIPKYKQIKYTYDFGDNWEHIIEVLDVQFDYDKNYATCIDGKGERPPEDVGGEGGYEQFLEVMSDPSHEDYEDIKAWYESQYYKGFKVDSVNRQLKYL